METILCPVREAARRAPNVLAVDARKRRLTYREFDTLVCRCSDSLLRLGATEGSRIALFVNDKTDLLALLLGVIRAGGVACLLSSRLPGAALEAAIRSVGCEMLITDDPGRFKAHLPATPVVASREVMEGPDPAPATSSIVLPADRSATIIFSSGTTGTPKAAMHSLANHYYSALGVNASYELTSGMRWLLSLPLFHVGGLGVIFRCITTGATIVIPDAAETVHDAVAARNVTHVSMVSTQLYRYLTETSGPPPEHLKAVMLGGGPVSPSLIADAVENHLPIYTSYGLTEMSSVVTTSPTLRRGIAPVGTGQVLPFRRLRISRDGEILVRGRTLFRGYVRGADVDEALDDDRWFHTGDLGEIDADGNLHVLGRLDNQFISGGENIQPEEIEFQMARVPVVVEAVVVPVDDHEFGRRPVAFVRWSPSAPVETREHLLREILERDLPRFKIPMAFYSWPEQAGPSGLKPSRAQMLKLAQELVSPPESR